MGYPAPSLKATAAKLSFPRSNSSPYPCSRGKSPSALPAPHPLSGRKGSLFRFDTFTTTSLDVANLIPSLN